ncbi:MAG: 50S ribosomal protein L6 [Acidobacteria bacterium]|nr:MAG: 50S ribosomal protein L6 [Acidobacteriota bacterium]
MSRIGKQPVVLDSSVKLEVGSGQTSVQGPKGKLTVPVPAGIAVKVGDGVATVERKDDSKSQRALHGLTRALLANAVHGVTKGFAKNLEIHGVGYRAVIKDNVVNFSLGYTHAVEFPIPEGIEVKVEKNTRLEISGFDKQQVGQVAAEMRALRPPDVYKLKGVRYAGELLRKKAGKTGA